MVAGYTYALKHNLWGLLILMANVHAWWLRVTKWYGQWLENSVDN